MKQTARLLCLAAAIVLGAAHGLRAQDAPAQEPTRPGTLLAATPMYWMRDASGSPMAILPAGAPVDVVKAEGSWYKVVFHDSRFGDETGYVAISSVRLETGEADPRSLRSLRVTERGFVEGRAFAFPQDAANDTTRLIADTLVREEVFVEPARWLRLAGGIDFRANSHEQVESAWRLDFSDRSLQRPRLAVRRLSATIRAKAFTLDIGKQFIRWARADIQNPTDRFAPRDFLNVLDSELLPVLAARPSLQLGKETLELVYVPRMTPSRVPLFDQRWTVFPESAAGISVVDAGADVPNRGEWGARWSHVADRMEGSLSYFDGFNHLPNIDARLVPDQGAVVLTRIYPRLRSYGADFAAPTRWFVLKGEAAYFTSPDSTSDEYVLYVAEIERQTGEWLLDVGYIGDVVTTSRESFPFAPDRGIAKSIIGRAAYTVDPRRSVAVEGAVRQGGEGLYVKGEFSEALGQHWRFTIAGVGIRGQEGDFLGEYRLNSHASAALRFSF